MKFDEHGHVIWTPKTLYDLAKTEPLRLVNRYLMTGTPWAFADYAGVSRTVSTTVVGMNHWRPPSAFTTRTPCGGWQR